MSDISDLLAALDSIAATPPGEQSLWDCTVAAWAADVIRDAQKIEARSDEIPQEARPEGQEPDGEADAPNSSQEPTYE